MYPHFIEINNTDLEGENIVNIDSIAFVCGDDEAQIILNIADRDDNTINCKESYDEVKKLIMNSGCIINKGDPRLDSRQLTVQDLKRMVGEPVWSAWRSQWMLVVGQNNDDPSYVDTMSATPILYSWDDKTLIEKPLYRMKVN